MKTGSVAWSFLRKNRAVLVYINFKTHSNNRFCDWNGHSKIRKALGYWYLSTPVCLWYLTLLQCACGRFHSGTLAVSFHV